MAASLSQTFAKPPELTGHLGLHVERGLAGPDAPRVAGLDELANLECELGVDTGGCGQPGQLGLDVERCLAPARTPGVAGGQQGANVLVALARRRRGRG